MMWALGHDGESDVCVGLGSKTASQGYQAVCSLFIQFLSSALNRPACVFRRASRHIEGFLAQGPAGRLFSAIGGGNNPASQGPFPVIGCGGRSGTMHSYPWMRVLAFASCYLNGI